MVYHSKPQGLGSRSIVVNANNPPQGLISGGGVGPIPFAMLYEDGTTMLYEDNTVMLYEDANMDFLMTEGGDFLMTENGDFLIL